MRTSLLSDDPGAAAARAPTPLTLAKAFYFFQVRRRALSGRMCGGLAVAVVPTCCHTRPLGGRKRRWIFAVRLGALLFLRRCANPERGRARIRRFDPLPRLTATRTGGRRRPGGPCAAPPRSRPLRVRGGRVCVRDARSPVRGERRAADVPLDLPLRPRAQVRRVVVLLS